MEIKDLLTTHIKPNDSFNAVFANIDIINNSNLNGTSEQISRTRNSVRVLIEELLIGLPIAIMDWRGDGGILLADGSNGADHLIYTCDKLVSLLPLFNRSQGKYNFLTHDIIHLRVVCHSEHIKNTGDHSTLTCDALNSLSKYEREVGCTDHVVMTDELAKLLNEDLFRRLTPSLDRHLQLGMCFTLDKDISLVNLELNRHESDVVRSWISNSVRSKQFDEVFIFAYTNESLYEYLASPLPGIKIEVVSRNWLGEAIQELVHNRQITATSGELGSKEFIHPWAKSKVISFIAETLVSEEIDRPFHNNIDARFYNDSPWLKGALLRNSRTGRRAAYIGIYPFKHPSRAHAGSPYIGDYWPAIWLSEDDGPKSAFLDAIEERFRELWLKGKGFSELRIQETNDISMCMPFIQKVWELNGLPYLIVYPGKTPKYRNRPFKEALTEDLIACRNIESFLSNVNAHVEIEIMEGVNHSKRVQDWPGHIIFICFRSFTKEICDYLENQNFPYTIKMVPTSQKEVKVPAVFHRLHRQYWESPMDRSPSEPKDYCIIGKCPKIEGEGNIFIIAGIHGLGTWGGSVYLTSNEHIRFLHQHIGNQSFGALIESTFEVPHRLERIHCIVTPEPFIK